MDSRCELDNRTAKTLRRAILERKRSRAQLRRPDQPILCGDPVVLGHEVAARIHGFCVCLAWVNPVLSVLTER
jgi:hypothetical protein